MDDSVKDVTLLAGFVFDVLREYEGMRSVCAPLFVMASGLDPNVSGAMVPITLYNDVCAWIETNIGAASMRRAGVAIGNRAFETILRTGKVSAPTPLAMMEALAWAASTMIHDPMGRGWEILSHGNTHVDMRRTQTFNCMLQEGLLLSLTERTDVLMPSVSHRACTRRGDDFCEYEVKWLNR